MFILIFICIVLVIVALIYLNSNEYMNKMYVKKTKHLLKMGQITQEEFDNLIQKVYKPKEKIIANLSDSDEVSKKNKIKNKNGIKHKEKIYEFSKEEIDEKKRQQTISVLLYLGVILITLSGIVFSITTWNILSGAIKAVLLFGFSGMLFGASIFAEKKLKIIKTSFAFWILGTIFFPITCISAGYLEVFGNYFSLNSDGKYLFALSSAFICFPIYFISIRKYFSKTYMYVAGINATLIAFFTFLNISTDTNVIIIAMSIYNLIVLNICNHIVTKAKLVENSFATLKIVSKITLVIITIITVLNTIFMTRLNVNIFNLYSKVDIMNLLSFVIIIGNYIYICMKKKDYLFSVLTVITTLCAFNNIYLYLIQKDIGLNIKYLSFMFICIAIVSFIFEILRTKIFEKIKQDGLTLLSKAMTLIFMFILLCISFSYIIDLNNKSYTVLIFAIVFLVLLLQKRFSYKNIQNILTKILDALISIFSFLILFSVYRYLTISLNINLIVYTSIIAFIPWIISKLISIIKKYDDFILYKIMGTIFLIIPFTLSFREILNDTVIIKLIIALVLVIVSIYNYFDFIKKYLKNQNLEIFVINIICISIFAPIYIFLTGFLYNIIPLYFTPYIAGLIIYIISLIDRKNIIFKKLKYYILATIILSNFLMIINMKNIFEYAAIQTILLILYLNKSFRNDLLYSTYMLFSIIINEIFVNSINIVSSDVLSILNSVVFLILLFINCYEWYEIKLLEGIDIFKKYKNLDNNKKNIYNRKQKYYKKIKEKTDGNKSNSILNLKETEELIKQKKFTLSIGLVLGIIPYMQLIDYLIYNLKILEVYNMIFAHIAIVFIVFIIEKIIYNRKNLMTYIIPSFIYFIAILNIFGLDEILNYSIMLLILVLVGAKLRNKSMFLVPSVFLIIFALKGTFEFWSKLPWWIYLLICGLILLYVAMKRELNRQKHIEKKENLIIDFLSHFKD